MEESQEILFNSLKSFGIEISSEISSFREINSSTLFSICAQSLRRLSLYSGVQSPSLPTSLPDSIADCVRICNDVACTLKNLGFVGDASFHKITSLEKNKRWKGIYTKIVVLREISEQTKQDSLLDKHNSLWLIVYLQRPNHNRHQIMLQNPLPCSAAIQISEDPIHSLKMRLTRILHKRGVLVHALEHFRMAIGTSMGTKLRSGIEVKEWSGTRREYVLITLVVNVVRKEAPFQLGYGGLNGTCGLVKVIGTEGWNFYKSWLIRGYWKGETGGKFCGE
ncbi:hypothetical protein V2J09_010996 [Rumex salicifolius]